MRIDSQLTDDAVLAELGERLARTRLERNLTQGALANEAGVARKVVHAMEAGTEFKITSLIRVLRALGLARVARSPDRGAGAEPDRAAQAPREGTQASVR